MVNPTANSRATGISVETRDLRKQFNGQPVLQGVSLKIQLGEIFVIMGPSGSGKSVLLRHLIGLETPDSGEVLIGGQSISTEVLDQYRLAMVFQSGALLNSITVSENVGLYLTEHQAMAEADIQKVVAQKLELVGLSNHADRLPSELSGGMKKRAAIARALVIEPQLILYDEPTSELDPLMAATIGREIARLRHRTGVTSVVVTHDRDLAFGIADRMALIHEGLIRCVGTPAEIRSHTDPIVRDFLDTEFSLTPN
ncbi:MAG: ATP-binding cassette domain-containing protein [Pedosphaera sp.]|nr:ATP-binding cassette domain-containing protein [Pedosphaera sp.]